MLFSLTALDLMQHRSPLTTAHHLTTCMPRKLHRAGHALQKGLKRIDPQWVLPVLHAFNVEFQLANLAFEIAGAGSWGEINHASQVMHLSRGNYRWDKHLTLCTISLAHLD